MKNPTPAWIYDVLQRVKQGGALSNIAEHSTMPSVKSVMKCQTSTGTRTLNAVVIKPGSACKAAVTLPNPSIRETAKRLSHFSTPFLLSCCVGIVGVTVVTKVDFTIHCCLAPVWSRAVTLDSSGPPFMFSVR